MINPGDLRVKIGGSKEMQEGKNAARGIGIFRLLATHARVNPMKTIEVCAAAIHDGKTVLVTERGYGEFKGGWEFPGGKIEPGETKEACIQREILEELRVEIDIDAYLGKIEYDYPSFHLSMHLFLCRVKNGSMTLVEHEAARFIETKDFDTVDFLPADRLALPLIEKALV